MTERERWIVYPLLFLALGSALRDKLFDQTMSKKIVCQELIVYGEDGGQGEPPRLVEIGAAQRSSPNMPQAGLIKVNGQIRAGMIYSDYYLYQGIPFAPTLLRAMPDWLRALQQSAEALQQGSAAAGQPPGNQDGARQESDAALNGETKTTDETKSAAPAEKRDATAQPRAE